MSAGILDPVVKNPERDRNRLFEEPVSELSAQPNESEQPEKLTVYPAKTPETTTEWLTVPIGLVLESEECR